MWKQELETRTTPILFISTNLKYTVVFWELSLLPRTAQGFHSVEVTCTNKDNSHFCPFWITSLKYTVKRVVQYSEWVVITISLLPSSELPELCTDLNEVAFKWYSLGIHLRLTADQLSRIQENLGGPGSANKVEHCFMAVIDSWRLGDQDEFCLDTLVKALRTIEFKGLAERVEEELKNKCKFHHKGQLGGLVGF